MAKETIDTLTTRGNRLKDRLERIDACMKRSDDKETLSRYEKEKKRRLAELVFIATKIEAMQDDLNINK